jgi:dTDP-4-amino-4,6-dideoxygalactose transaminase
VTATNIAMVDLHAQQRRLQPGLERAIAGVLAHGAYILGPEVRELERQLAAFAGARHCLSCSSGTDALVLALMATGVGRGDAVIVPSFTFVATAEAVVLAGATPYFVDVLEDGYLIDPGEVDRAMAQIRAQGLRPRAVIPVDLFGHPADYGAIEAIAKRHGLIVIADAAQSFGAQQSGRRVGTLAAVTATSFFPAKPLGCYGDGGAVFTDDDVLAGVMESLRVHGKGRDKYDNVRIGINGRLDTLQAAILLEKLAIFAEEIEARDRIARRYSERLAGIVRTPAVAPGSSCVWAQYTIALAGRDAVAERLRERGVPTAVYYPKPLHAQTAYRHCPRSAGDLPVSTRAAGVVLSLPMHAYLEEATQDYIISALRGSLR